MAQYLVSMPPGSTAVVEFGPDTNYGLRTSAVPATAPTVSILVAGMKQNSTYHMRAVITRADSAQQFDRDQVFHTGAAPGGRTPAMTLTIPPGTNPSPGVELVSLNPPTKDVGTPLRVVALDPAGELIWYYDFDPTLGITQPIKLLPNGHLLMVLFGGTTEAGGMVREIDLAGQTIHQFTVDQLNRWLTAAGNTWTANAIHHDIVELPNGHLLVLVNSHKKFANMSGHRGSATVLGDAIVELDTDFNPVWVWSSFDHLDVNRHPMMFPDWTHINTVLYSPDDGNLVFSIRNQSWVVKIDYANGHGSGKILWRLGYLGDFELLDSTSPADWFFAQHFATFNSSNTTGDFQLALFDNGNDRVLDSSRATCNSSGSPAGYSWPSVFGGSAPLCFSRPAIFEVNETTRTARRLWSSPVPYSYWGGTTMTLPNGNVFFDIARPTDLSNLPLDRPKPTLTHTLIEGLVMVSLVIVIFMWRLPMAFIPLATIPIAMILAFAPVLGGIAVAIGLFVDASAVMFGQADKNPDNPTAENPEGIRKQILSALRGVGRPSFLVLVVFAVSFLPWFTPLDDPTGARVLEVTQQEPPRILWQLDVNGQESYRTIHLPSLYPGVQW